MLISVAMPTYKRLDLLKRAIGDVFAQTWQDWELVVSDDEEDDAGETWQYLQELARRESRVKILKNTRGRHGQVFNVNSATLATSGEWIKPFFDDDRMKKDCLESFAEIAGSTIIRENNVVLIGCRAERWRDGKFAGEDPDFAAHDVEVIGEKDARLAMCLFDRWNGRTPTHMMMRGDVVRAGATMVEDGAVKHTIDVRWFGRMLEHGAFAMTRRALVCECQGEVESGTSQLWREEGRMTEDNRRVYLEIYDRAQKDSRWPSRSAIDSELCGVRAAYHLKKRQFALGLKYAALALRSIAGVRLAVKAMRRIAHPGRYPATDRIF